MKSNLNENLYPWLPNADILQVFDWQDVFKNKNPVEVDLGAGDGGFILEMAKENPDTNYIAVERLLGRIRKIAKRCIKNDYKNLRVLRLESYYFLKRMCPPKSLDVIHIMFPDPWPKRRHFKNRLIQPDFIQAAHQALKEGGILKFSTDYKDYFDWTKKTWATEVASGQWQDLGEWDYSKDPVTEFQKTFNQEGRQTYRARWQAI